MKEMMKKVQTLIVGCMVLLAFILMIEAGVIKPADIIYITNEECRRTLSGETWILEYAINGEFHAPIFHTEEEMWDYRKYLGTIGNIYRKEKR